MRYCKNCRILYSSSAAACPKCGVTQPEPSETEEASATPDKRRVRNDWLWLVIGVPVLIGVIYIAALILKQIG